MLAVSRSREITAPQEFSFIAQLLFFVNIKVTGIRITLCHAIPRLRLSGFAHHPRQRVSGPALLGDLDQFHFENEGGIGRDGA